MNIYSQENAPKASWITKTMPQLQLIGENDLATFALTYSGTLGAPTPVPGITITMIRGALMGILTAVVPNKIALGAGYANNHDRRGEAGSEGVDPLSRSEPDEYVATIVKGAWEFSPFTRFGITISGSQGDIEYQNNCIETQFRDRSKMILVSSCLSIWRQPSGPLLNRTGQISATTCFHR